MARPRSEDKRNAILAAAVTVFAAQGAGAPTAKIAKSAAVAEGTLFTYFSNKDELLNHLYLALKDELRELMMSDYPRSKSVKSRARHVWKRYVAWGVAHPDKRKVMALLGLSERVSERSKAQGMQAFADVNAMLHESVAKGVLRAHPPGFVAAIMSSLAETTMDFMSREPAQAELYSDSGFEAFWNAIAKK
jgi:AcrR family transcriptional regulator